jgi:CopG-like RHH_1 or ribbon-helix-helix domain, RHH_5
MLAAMPARSGRPPLGKYPMTSGERKARSRQVVRPEVVQLNVEVPAEVRESLRQLADATGKTQAAILVAAVKQYVARRR